MSIVSASVVRCQPVSSNVVHLQLQRPDGMIWETGQFARLGLETDSETVFRAYSIASCPSSATVDFFITRVPDGVLSPRLHALKAGQTVQLDTQCNGLLSLSRLQPGGRTLWLMATGTGVAPFIALLQDTKAVAAFDRLFVIHGVRTVQETAYVRDYAQRSPNVRLISLVTREAGGDLSVRIPEALASGALETLAGERLEPAGSRVLLCGNPQMVRQVRDQLKSRGLTTPRGGAAGQFLAENFWL